MPAPECEAFGADGTFRNGQRRVDSDDFIPNGHTIALFVHSMTQRKKEIPHMVSSETVLNVSIAS